MTTRTKKLTPKVSADASLRKETIVVSGPLSTDLIRTRNLFLLLWGPPGSGKTLFAHQIPGTRTLDFDDGMDSVIYGIQSGLIKRKLEDVIKATILPPASMDESGDIVFDAAYQQIHRWLREEREDPSLRWDYLILDSITTFLDALLVKGLKETDRLGLSHSWESRNIGPGLTPTKIQDFGAAMKLLEKLFKFLRGIGKNIIFITHEDALYDKNGTLIALNPTFQGKHRTQFPKNFGEIWYMRVESNTKGEGFKRFVQTDKDHLRNLRSRLGCLDFYEEPDFVAIRQKVADFYDIPTDELWKGSLYEEEEDEEL